MNELYGELFISREGGIDLLIYSWIRCNEIAEDFPRIRPYWRIDYTRNEKNIQSQNVSLFVCIFCLPLCKQYICFLRPVEIFF
jgi:hypothetical protein